MALAWAAEAIGGKEPIIGSRSRLFLPNKWYLTISNDYSLI